MTDVPPIRCVILGGGGHARVLIDCLLAGGMSESLGVLDQDRSLWGTEMLGAPILGGDDLITDLVKQGTTTFVVGLGGIGDNGPRRRLFELGLRHGLKPRMVCHPRAVISRWATVGEGSVVFPGAVVNAGAVLGVNVIVNTGAIVEHDCEVGDHAHLATGSRLCSTVRVGAGAHIGAGATVLQLRTIGEGAIVGAGAVVVDTVEPWTVVVGTPARILEKVRERTSNPTSVSTRLRP